MKSARNFFNRDMTYRAVKKDLTRRYGKEKVNLIFEFATIKLSEFYKEYDDIPKEKKFHTHNSIFPRIALFKALEQEIPDCSVGIIDDAVRNTATKASGIIGKLVKLPGMPRTFIKIMSVMLEKSFGPEAGFSQKTYETNKHELKFDITSCPYYEFCKLTDGAKIAHSFCDGDIYLYGNLPGITFERTQTLATGGSLCDFHFKIEEK